MFSLGQIKTGSKIILHSQPHEVLSANHIMLGRGQAKLQTKLKNLLSGSIIDQTFSGNDKLEPAEISYQKAQFLYTQDQEAHFMSSSDFSQASLKLSDSEARFLTEGREVDLIKWNNQAIGIKLPTKVELTVSYTEPGYKGNTANDTRKIARLETGTELLVPLFINSGDKIIVNTETGDYVSRS